MDVGDLTEALRCTACGEGMFAADHTATDGVPTVYYLSCTKCDHTSDTRHSADAATEAYFNATSFAQGAMWHVRQDLDDHKKEVDDVPKT